MTPAKTVGADENFFPTRFIYDFETHCRHFARYFTALKSLNRLGEGERWLDCACGSGYGTRLLADFASEVVGYDISDDVVSYASHNYTSPNCSFLSVFPSGHFDVVFCVETIEHLPRADSPAFLAQLSSILKPHGDLLISTPLVPKSDPNPSNPFHLYEYSGEELKALLNSCGFEVRSHEAIPTTFTDGERKIQGLFKCQKT